jgi:hypothetical protein
MCVFHAHFFRTLERTTLDWSDVHPSQELKSLKLFTRAVPTELNLPCRCIEKRLGAKPITLVRQLSLCV